MSFLGQVKGFGSAILGSDYLRDYRHAAKTFRTKSYAFAPKYKFLFHTYFRVNEAAYPEGAGKNFGVLVKDVKLPSFTPQVTQLNQYNRKRLVQTKLKYDPVNISFHDDNSNVINKLWYAYYTYYYTDGTKPYLQFIGYRDQSTSTPRQGSNTDEGVVPAYSINNIYSDQITGDTDWGFNGDSAQVEGTKLKKVPFFKDITVFGFNQHSYTAYTLINPMITNFAHDTYNYEEGSGVMKNTMMLDYETVVYTEGAIDGRTPGNIVGGFGDNATYDRKTSPIMLPGANATFLGPGGIADAAGGIVGGFKNGVGLGLVNTALTAGRAYNAFKGKDLIQTAKYEMMNMLAQSAWEYGSPIARNRNILFDMPSKSVTPYNIGVAGSPTIAPPEAQNVTAMPNKPAIATAGVQVTSTNQVTGINFIPPYG